jgi:ABC-type nitrate/sulfonate/bicarbonate transport system substrate-binding protein
LVGGALAVLAQPAGAVDKVMFGQVSPTATVWPGTVATKKGFFAANNVAMDVVSIGVSPGMQAVSAGSLDIMHNTCNAPISFYEGGGTNVRISMVSMSSHPAVLIGKKGIESAVELKGKVVGTSSIKSGSTILLRRLLKSRGLGDKDYDVVAGQGSAQIFNGLQAGALDAVWLVPPQSYAAASAGYSVLGSFREVAPQFPFVCHQHRVARGQARRRAPLRQGLARGSRLAARSRQSRRGGETARRCAQGLRRCGVEDL